MRRVFSIALLAALCLIPAAAFAQSSGNSTVEGFGGLSLNGFETHSPSLGGTLTFTIVPGVKSSVRPDASATCCRHSPIPSSRLRAPTCARRPSMARAAYASSLRRGQWPRTRRRPPACAGLDISSARFGTIGNAVSDIALGLAGRTAPLAGVGGGVVLRGGPVVLDVGYRYKQLFPNAVVEAALGLGQPLRTHQVRAGIGVRL